MMMKRRHEEQALLCALEVEHLDHDGKRFDHKEPTDDKRDDLSLRNDGDAAERHAEREPNPYHP